jgi:hypothetical protein
MKTSTNNLCMRKNSILLFSFCLLCIVLISSSCRYEKKNELPTIVFNTPFTFNTIGINDTSKFSISITNTGKEDVKLQYIKIQCGCLSNYSYNFFILKSGCSDSITFTYKPFKTGYIEENVFAYFVGYNKPVHLLIKGRVLKKKTT